DEKRSESVIKVFVDLHNKGLIYRGVRMVNWDPKALTAISDEEVNYKEQNGKLYYLRYKIAAPPSPPEGGDVSSVETNFGYLTANIANYGLLKEFAKNMRRFSTEAESALWEMLRRKNFDLRFRRQHVIGDFIVDFVCLQKKLIIEVDGGYHNEPDAVEHDRARTEILNNLGFSVIRFSNEEVIGNTDKVLETIKAVLTQTPLPLDNIANTTTLTSPPLEGLGEAAIIATTRPETIFGDVAVCINPNNPKTAWLKGKRLIVPVCNREIPVIEDEYVDMEFGTGCLKVTPAHDVNDYMLGEKYSLETLNIFNDDGTLNQYGLHYEGKDRFAVRKLIEKELEENGLMEKVEAYTNKVGFSERTDVPIEPKLSMQWFLKMADLAKPALQIVENDTIKFYPAKFKNTYRHWMETIKDWNISRQLWWGHRIPAYYLTLPTGEKTFVVAETKEQAYEKALSQFPILNSQFSIDDLRQDEDTLDTWFSSWLWPISVFDGINNPDNEEINYYYPTNDLITAPEIIFFWVARMIMSGYEYRNKECFKNVYFTGIVRDKLGRKMSKSLGNSPDPIELMKKYGADGVRMGMLLSSPAGNDLPFDESQCEQGRNFSNKIWNAFRLVQGWEVSFTEPFNDVASLAGDWFEEVLEKAIVEIDDLFSKYRISEALMLVYKLFWDDFCAWYLEMIKPEFGKPIDQYTISAATHYFDVLLRILHPFMPFITEELWQVLKDMTIETVQKELKETGKTNQNYLRALQQYMECESIMITEMPKISAKLESEIPEYYEGDEDDDDEEYFEDQIASFDEEFAITKQIIAGIRSIRQQKNIAPKEKLTLQIFGEHNELFDEVIKKLGNISEIESINSSDEGENPSRSGLGGAVSFLVGTTEYAVPVEINIEEEIEKMQKEIVYLEGFLKSTQNKLSNERFVANAKPEVVENERKKLADAESKIQSLREGINKLKIDNEK
ncbi:MAG: valine--tRNA ligase, partial [Paludibacter sp.]|nr:valine--tRNA ligase [Paludibacter sp.]